MKKILFSCLLLALSSFSFADWQYTRWGMTPDEVIAASNEKMEKFNAPNGSAAGVFLKSKYQSENHTFTAYFSFSRADNKLYMVSLSSTSGGRSCVDLTKSLIEKYGQPSNTTNVGSNKYGATWESVDNNKIVFLLANDKCHINYTPVNLVMKDLKSHTDKGL